MSNRDFIWLCGEYGILPSIALEDDGVVRILKSKVNDTRKQLELSGYLKANF